MSPGQQPTRACPHCSNGVLWRNDATGEVTCNLCFTSEVGSHAPDPATKQADRREECYSHPDYDTYDGSNIARINGGYERAYYSWVTGDEYAIDQYDEIVDGLYVPHERNWQRQATLNAD